MHDFNPGITPNGLFWTMEIPPESFVVRRGGRGARLRLRNAPVPDTFFFANNVSVAAEIDVDLNWIARSDVITRGNGTSVPPDAPDAYLGEMRDATCRGRADGRETGFAMRSSWLTEEGFVAFLGHSRNGVYL
ncbi:MAG: hypothetical protein AAGA93_01730 [Actinomycetota bacterium]